MTVTIRAKTDPVLASGSSFVINKPTGTLTGDLMILAIYSANAAGNLLKVPAGWHQLRGGVNGTASLAVFFKIAGASEPADYTLTSNLSQSTGVGIISLYGAAPLAIDAMATQINTSSANRTFPSVTASDAGLWLMLGSLGSGFNSAPPIGATEQWDVTISSSRAYAMTATIAAAGATGTLAATGSASTSKCTSIAIVESPTVYPCPDLRSVTVVDAANAGTSFTCTIPADVEPGDLLLFHASFDADRTVSDPAGWTLLESIAVAGGLRLWWRVAVAGDAGATVTVNFTGGTVAIGRAISAYVSRSGRTLTIGNHAQGGSASAATVTWPTIVASHADALLVCLLSCPDTASISVDSGQDFWERYDSGSTGVRTVLCTQMLFAAGATGTRVASWTTGSHVGNVVSLTIEEVAEGILYNGVDLRPWLKSWSLENIVGVADTTVLVSEGKEQLPILPSWIFTCTGLWDQALDNIFGAAVASSQTATNSLFVEIGGAVSYESARAFVAQYKPSATIDDVWVWSAKIGISGVVERGLL